MKLPCLIQFTPQSLVYKIQGHDFCRGSLFQYSPGLDSLLGSVWLVAVEGNGEVIMDLPPSFILDEKDYIYVCGTVDALNRFYDAYQQGESTTKAAAG